MEIEKAVKLCEQFGLETRKLNQGRQLNIKDLSGIWHSFYPSTGTVVFNKFDDRSKKCTMYNVDFTATFVHKYFCRPDNIQNLFKEETTS